LIFVNPGERQSLNIKFLVIQTCWRLQRYWKVKKNSYLKITFVPFMFSQVSAPLAKKCFALQFLLTFFVRVQKFGSSKKVQNSFHFSLLEGPTSNVVKSTTKHVSFWLFIRSLSKKLDQLQIAITAWKVQLRNWVH
jgi:hypothetical protein